MTLPGERLSALKSTKLFLQDLLDPKITPRVPRLIRIQAMWCLKHYPWLEDIDAIADALPDLYAKERKRKK